MENEFSEEFKKFRKSMGMRGHRRIEDFTDLDWQLIDITIGILERHQGPVARSVLRGELAKATNICPDDVGWYITDVLTYDPIIEGEVVHVLEVESDKRGCRVSTTNAFKKYYDERKIDRKKTP